MEVAFIVLAPADRAPSVPAFYKFDLLGGSIGRGHDCDWTLPDSQRYLSSCHARIGYSGGSFYVEDTSTNGLYLNSDRVPIGKKQQVALNDGDTLSLGHYRLLTQILRDGAEPDLTVAEQQSVSIMSEMTPSKALSGSLPSEIQSSDYLVKPDKTAASVTSTEQIGLDDLLSLMAEPGSASSAPEQASQTFVPPRAEQHSLEHEDEEQPLMPVSSGQPPASKPERNVDSARGDDVPFENIDQEFRRDKLSLREESPQTSSHSPVLEDRRHHDAKLGFSTLADSVGSNTLALDEKDYIDLRPSAGELCWKQLLNTLGINSGQEKLSSQKLAQDMGELLLGLLAGALETTRSRTAFKNRYRLSMTLLDARESNPFKFCLNTNQLLQQLLLDPQPESMALQKAVNEICTQHQLHENLLEQIAYSAHARLMENQINEIENRKGWLKRHRSSAEKNVIAGIQGRIASSYEEALARAEAGDNSQSDPTNLGTARG